MRQIIRLLILLEKVKDTIFFSLLFSWHKTLFFNVWHCYIFLMYAHSTITALKVLHRWGWIFGVLALTRILYRSFTPNNLKISLHFQCQLERKHKGLYHSPLASLWINLLYPYHEMQYSLLYSSVSYFFITNLICLHLIIFLNLFYAFVHLIFYQLIYYTYWFYFIFSFSRYLKV